MRLPRAGPPYIRVPPPGSLRVAEAPIGNAYIAVAGQEDTPLTDSREALRTLTLEIKAGKADQLLQSAQLAVRGNVISTLRFFLRPASVELSAIGYCSP